MSKTRPEKNKQEDERLSGCDTMEKLWESAQKCYLTEPGISGTPGRISNFVTCGNIYPFMRIAALKCWHERTKLGVNPSALFTPLDLSDDPKEPIKVKDENNQSSQPS